MIPQRCRHCREFINSAEDHERDCARTDARTWTEYRAVYTRPASYLDKEYAGKSKVVEERTRPYTTKEAARAAAMVRAEESHAFVTGYETRQVTATAWWGDQQ